MNERIKQLAEQACFDEIGKDYSLYFNLTKDKVEKFAELIVSECVMLCDKVYEQNDNLKIKAGATFCREDIKEHFGVES